MTSGKPLTDKEKENILEKIPTTFIGEIARQHNRNTYTISKFLRTSYEERRKELIKEGVSYPIADEQAYSEIYERKK